MFGEADVGLKRQNAPCAGGLGRRPYGTDRKALYAGDRDSHKGPRRAGGFSLVELILVITVTGIVAAAVGLFIGGPILGFLDQSRRAGLVDAAQVALQRMGRDLRSALPNSVRITGSGRILELLATLDGDRYRVEPPGTDADRLSFAGADASFNTLARLDPGGVTAGLRLAIYPLTQTGANPWADPVVTPESTMVTLGGTATVGGFNEHRVVLSSPHAFPFDSPSRRVFLVQGPVSYVCDRDSASPNFRRLLRYAGYAAQPAQPTTFAVAPAVVIADLEACTLQYDAGMGPAQRNAVVTAILEVGASGETVRLLRQFHLDNTP